MKQNTKGNIRRVTTFGLGLALGLSFLTGTASATPAKGKGDQGKSSASKTCDGSPNSNTGHGANQSGPYNNTCYRGDDSENGNGGGGANGRPCAGCVGNADDKNPPGQQPGPEDHNNGYECDGNNGVGKGNPAHTGCGSESSTPPSDNSPPACPAGEAAMKAHSFVVDGKHVEDITGKVSAGDTVEANFTIAANCPTQKVSLVSYVAQSATPNPSELAVHKSDTGTFGPGKHSLTVKVSSCFFQVDFVLGDVITKFENNAAYGDRQIDRDNGGSSCVTAGPKDPGSTGGNTGTNPVGTNPVQTVVTTGSTAVVPVVTPAVTVDGTPIATDVLGTEIAAAPAAQVIGAVDGGAPAVTGGTSQLRGRPTRVLGVQVERGPAASGLARTGFTLLPIAGLGTALCLLGVALTSARKRNDEESIAIADRLAGS